MPTGCDRGVRPLFHATGSCQFLEPFGRSLRACMHAMLASCVQVCSYLQYDYTVEVSCGWCVPSTYRRTTIGDGRRGGKGFVRGEEAWGGEDHSPQGTNPCRGICVHVKRRSLLACVCLGPGEFFAGFGRPPIPPPCQLLTRSAVVGIYVRLW